MTRGIRLAALLSVLCFYGCFDAIELEPPELGFGGEAGDGRSLRGAGGAAGFGGAGGEAGVGGATGLGGGAGGVGGSAGAAGAGGAAGLGGAAGMAGSGAAAGGGGSAGFAGAGGATETGPQSCPDLCSSFLDWRIAELQCLGFALSLAGLPAFDERGCRNVRDARGCERCLTALGASDRVCEAAALICGF